jgi:hypothetical protein
LEGAPPAVNRWQRLISIVGVLSTLSAIAGELAGYFTFLRNANEFVDVCITSIVSIFVGTHLTSSALLMLKVALAVLVVWTLFLYSLHRYAKTHEHTTIYKWINEVNFFLLLEQGRRLVEYRKICFFVFVALPPMALFKASIPPWHVNRLLVIGGLQIRLWPYIIEVAFSHALLFFFVMGVSLLFKMGSAIG